MAADTPQHPQSIALPVVWVGAEDVPVSYANAFVGVAAPGEIFITIGSVLPPAIVGATQEERAAALRAVSFVQAKPIARLALTPGRLDELIQALQETKDNYVKMMQMLKPPNDAS